MAKKERTLVLDIGSTAIHAGEFELDQQTGAMVLHAFENIEFPEAPSETNRNQIVAATIRQLMEGGKFTATRCSLCVSGQAAFMRFVKLPPVTEDESSIRQIVEYEARQNVPFPMEEVIWDYQLIGSNEEDLEVMFAVIKNEIVDGVINAVNGMHLHPTLVDFAPAALYNAARANYIGENECAMLLDIGGRCTNLLFLDGARFYARAIPIAGFSITQQVAKEFGIPVDEAEVLKRRHGFVALGGAYEEPESEVAATISKIIRNVMTRLHGEINRSINVYRTQQKGNKPTALYLAGGSSIMQYTNSFFSEKLRMDVSWFNPFKIVTLGPNIDAQKLQEVAHLMPEVVGVALRDVVECPIEISLITENLKRADAFGRRKPFIAASCGVWLLILFVFWLINILEYQEYKKGVDFKGKTIDDLTNYSEAISKAFKKRDEYAVQAKQVTDVLDRRYDWTELLNHLQAAKPLDLWLTYARPRGAAAKAAKTGPSGPSSIFGGGGEEEESTAASGNDVTFVSIHGYCVSIPEGKEKTPPQYSRPLFTPEQIKQFEANWAQLPPAMTKAPEGEDATKADNPAVMLQRFKKVVETNAVEPNVALAEIYVQSLHCSPFFSPAVKETRLKSYTPGTGLKNIATFEIEVKLIKPISTAR